MSDPRILSVLLLGVLICLGCPVDEDDDAADDDTTAADDDTGDDDTGDDDTADDDVSDDDTSGDDDVCGLGEWVARVVPDPGDTLLVEELAMGDVDGDGAADLLFEAVTQVGGGHVYLYRGPLSGEVSLADADAHITSAAISALEMDGDANGDGIGDAWFGAGAVNKGYLFHGPITGELTTGDAAAVLSGEDSSDEAGWALAYVGDMDGDGADDVVVGAPEYGDDRGAVYLVTGPPQGTVELTAAAARFRGEHNGDQLGYAVDGAGDVNGDGVPDVIVGARRHYETPGPVLAGAAYVLHGPLAGEVELSAAAARMLGQGEADKAGSSVAGAGDLNGDGFDDVMVGAPNESSVGWHNGAVYVLFGPLSGDIALANADVKLVAPEMGWEVGHDIAAAGDVDGDGQPEVALAVRGIGAFVLGTAALTSGDLDGAEWALNDGTGLWYLGLGIAAGGNAVGDAGADIALGAYPSEDQTTYTGGVYLFGCHE